MRLFWQSRVYRLVLHLQQRYDSLVCASILPSEEIVNISTPSSSIFRDAVRSILHRWQQLGTQLSKLPVCTRCKKIPMLPGNFLQRNFLKVSMHKAHGCNDSSPVRIYIYICSAPIENFVQFWNRSTRLWTGCPVPELESDFCYLTLSMPKPQP